jgi:hypothetical protein
VVEGVNSNMIYLVHCKNLSKCKCHNVLPPSTSIKEKKELFSVFKVHILVSSMLYLLVKAVSGLSEVRTFPSRHV